MPAPRRTFGALPGTAPPPLPGEQTPPRIVRRQALTVPAPEYRVSEIELTAPDASQLVADDGQQLSSPERPELADGENVPECGALATVPCRHDALLMRLGDARASAC